MCLLEGSPAGGWSRSFAAPRAVFTSRDGRGSLRWHTGAVETADGDAFLVLQQLLEQHSELTAAGYWSYDLRYPIERLPRIARDDLSLPDCWVGLYEGEAALPDPPLESLPLAAGRLDDSVTRTQYEGAVRGVLEYIAAGDCYQVNLSHRLSTSFAGSSFPLYRKLREVSPAPYAAYLDCGDHQVLSSSPELFLRIRDREVETRPIKGTRPRGRTPEEDAARAAELLSSPKDRAELLMIVDLERNDLGRVCEYGSVHVPELFLLESYSNVHHLVATVRGRLRADVGPLECLRAAFPGGSITGAPKIRAMEIIEELEPVRRGVYTGAIGWVDGRGNAEWNIAIRTMVVKDGRVHLGIGGGIVADSDPGAEYLETLDKAAGMLAALGIG
jgi:para-aminobenzoate synthetase component I